MTKETGGPAFPPSNPGYAHGMTIRDYFAAKALPLAMKDYRMNIDRVDECLDLEWEADMGLSFVAARAYELADAMLKAREQ